jgi:hypothetical protein
MTILHSQCLPTELVKTANAVAINSVSGPVTGVVAPTSAPATGASVWYIDTSTSPDNLYYWNGSVWTLVGDGTGSSALITQDESVALGSTTTMNFAGGGVTATYAAGVTTVTVPSATSLAFQDEGVALASTSTVNFAGAGVVATNAAGVTTVTIPGGSGTFATNAEAQAGTSTALLINPANLYSRENIAAQTGVSNVVASLAAPTASQSNWAVNLLGETLHYAPGLGWKIVANKYTQTIVGATNAAVSSGGTLALATYVAPRAGTISASFSSNTVSSGATPAFNNMTLNQNALTRSEQITQAGTSGGVGMAATVSATFPVVAGDVLNFLGQWFNTSAGVNYSFGVIAYTD